MYYANCFFMGRNKRKYGGNVVCTGCRRGAVHYLSNGASPASCRIVRRLARLPSPAGKWVKRDATAACLWNLSLHTSGATPQFKSLQAAACQYCHSSTVTPRFNDSFSPNASISFLWSNDSSDRFGFRSSLEKGFLGTQLLIPPSRLHFHSRDLNDLLSSGRFTKN